MKTSKRKPTPTAEQFRAYEGAFGYFNRALFGDTLPATMLNFSRKARAMGFYRRDAWRRGDTAVPEISLNPDTLLRSAGDSLSTLVHEMCHHWQYCFGSPGRGSYHNAEWGAKMIEVGLHPSSTGEPGGKMTGQRVSHYVLEAGPFALAFAACPQDVLLPWTSSGSLSAGAEKRKQKQKTAYCCAGCQTKVWGRAGLSIVCATCTEPFLELT